jgi:hypothetical protein
LRDIRRVGEVVTQGSAKPPFAGSNPARASWIMEYGKSDSQAEYDQGYSEKQSALDTEIQAGGWRNLGSFTDFKAYSRQQKIFLVYQALSNNLCQMISSVFFSAQNEEEGFLKELKTLRMIQDILLNCLLWEQKGQLEKDMIPKEVWDLIQ